MTYDEVIEHAKVLYDAVDALLQQPCPDCGRIDDGDLYDMDDIENEHPIPLCAHELHEQKQHLRNCNWDTRMV